MQWKMPVAETVEFYKVTDNKPDSHKGASEYPAVKCRFSVHTPVRDYSGGHKAINLNSFNKTSIFLINKIGEF